MSLVLPETWNGKKPEADFVIVSNSTRFPPQALAAALSGTGYAVFHHDFWHCRFRLFFALQEKCKSCVWMPPWRALYNGAKLNIFMSPLQRDACFSIMPELSGKPYVLSPSLLDPAAWPRLEADRKTDTVFGLNCLLPFKGRANVLDYARNHPDKRFMFAGAAEGEGELPPNSRWLGPLDDVRLRQLYGSSENFLHLPATPQPCERSVIEARLSGCSLIVNSLVGACSYKEWALPEEQYRAWLAEQPARIWREIESLAGQVDS